MNAFIHTHYSLLESTINIKELVENAKAKGYRSLILCDSMTLAAAVPFCKTCKEEGIVPILGLEAVVDDNPVVVIARNLGGWKKLLRIVSRGNDPDQFKNRACLSGELFDSIIKDENYDDVFVVHDYENPEYVFPYYLDEKDAADHRLLCCLGMKTTLGKSREKLELEENAGYRKFFESNSHYLPECSSLDTLSELCEEFSILSSPVLPHFICPDGISEPEYLKQLCREGWKKVLIPSGVVDTKEKQDVYKDRILSELEIIEGANISGYFLILADLVNEFKNRGYLIGSGRGCFLPDSRVKMEDETYTPISFVGIGDRVFDAFGNIEMVYDVLEYDIDEEIIEIEFENGKIIRCTQDHKFLTKNREWVEAQHLDKEDDIVEV